MSTNSDISGENVKNDFNIEANNYAVYIFNINKHHISVDRKTSSDNSKSADFKQSDTDESCVSLSLLETNLDAKQETIVRCHLLKTFSVSENAGFENEGKFVILSDEAEEFGCYYHHLTKDVPTSSESISNEESERKPFKKISFFICLIGPTSGIMESFCYEFGAFCYSLLSVLDPEGHENSKATQHKLQNWYSYCVEYSKRCIEKFKENLVVLFQSALCGRVVIDCDDESVLWDLTRFTDACSLNTLLQINSSFENIELSTLESASEDVVNLKVKDDVISTDHVLSESSYCQIWVDKLLSCNPDDHQLIRSILENFRLKTVQDLNTLKRLLKKSENDYYSLYRAYLFVKASGYENILLYHVKQEALLSANEEVLCIIKCLKDFISDNNN